MTKKTVSILAIAAVIVAAVAYSVFAFRAFVPPRDTSLTRVSLRLQWLDQAQFAGFYVALAKGFYKKNGLDVQINSGGPDFNAMTLVAAGSDTFGIWTGDQIVLAIAKGLPLTPIGAIFNQSLAAYMVKASSDIRTPKDFEGRTVGMYYGYDTETLYLSLLSRFSVDRSKIHETPVQFDLARFFSGEIDVWPSYAINQPIAAELNGVPVRLITPHEFGIKYYSDVLFVRSDYLRTHKDVVSAFIRASVAGWRYALDHRDEAVDIIISRTPSLKREQQKRMLDIVATYLNVNSVPSFFLDESTWRSIETILQDQGLLKEPPPLQQLIQGNDTPR
ncbi:ABC transporter substrate-binding protein [Rhodopseudomonas palustris]|uniref:ABC transporter substrate-binding protein n=1 Tax=Rhodopseudomonas palustris TaxID=1076 RepID=UPI0020CC62FA|nr:ABC transporter substrate-binding protein [Rhodopseudomonas palustris]MCP9625972.1 ABC transporter substrate-binding protein [Rhodopseudomonas palustris]